MTHDEPAGQMTDLATEGVLNLAVVRDLRTIDRLLDALAMPDEGPALLARLTHESSAGSVEAVRGRGLGGLEELKRGGKRRVAGSGREFERMLGSWEYIVAVAGGLAFHGSKLSSTDAGELRELLLDLAEVVRGAWEELFREAAHRCGGATSGVEDDE